MGAALHKPSETVYIVAPPIRTPFTDMLSQVNMHADTPCEGFELRMYDCFEAHGPYVGRHKCKLLWQDFSECAFQYKQMGRLERIRQERQKRYVANVMGLTDKPGFLTYPHMDGFAPDPLSDFNF